MADRSQSSSNNSGRLMKDVGAGGGGEIELSI